jgi:hypothetical protein
MSTGVGKKSFQKEYMEYLINSKNRGEEDPFWVTEDQLSCVKKSSLEH